MCQGEGTEQARAWGMRENMVGLRKWEQFDLAKRQRPNRTSVAKLRQPGNLCQVTDCSMECGLEDGHAESREAVRSLWGQEKWAALFEKHAAEAMYTGEDSKIYVTDIYSFLALNPIRQTGGEGKTPRRLRGRGGAAKDGEKGNKKGDKHHPVHNFTQGHFWSQCEFNIESVLFHNEYLAKPLKSVSEYLKIIHWRGRLLAFNNATVHRCSFPVLFMALDLSVEFSLSKCKNIKIKPYRKGQALQLGAISHPPRSHSQACSDSQRWEAERETKFHSVHSGSPQSEHLFSVRGN